MEQKIKQTDIFIGKNIRKIRLSKGIHQTELVRMLQLQNINITRESLVKIERGIQHITASQLRGIRDCLNTTYDELLEPDETEKQVCSTLLILAFFCYQTRSTITVKTSYSNLKIYPITTKPPMMHPIIIFIVHTPTVPPISKFLGINHK